MRKFAAPPRAALAALAAVVVFIVGGCASTQSTQEGVLRGEVVGLSDGDTIKVLDRGTTYKIRLMGIDAPERGQPFSKRSTQHLSSLVFRKKVEVHWEKKDFYQRILGKVMVEDPSCERCPLIDVNLRQVEAGLAWWYRQYAKEQTPKDRALYERAELASREAKLGLWVDPEPVPPWEWRRDKRMRAKKKREQRVAPVDAGAAPAESLGEPAGATR